MKAKPFKKGDIVRYSYGPTALMKLTGVSRNHGGVCDRWYGLQYYGGSMGEYADKLTHATPAEVQDFRTNNHIGRLRDCPELAEVEE